MSTGIKTRMPVGLHLYNTARTLMLIATSRNNNSTYHSQVREITHASTPQKQSTSPNLMMSPYTTMKNPNKSSLTRF